MADTPPESVEDVDIVEVQDVDGNDTPTVVVTTATPSITTALDPSVVVDDYSQNPAYESVSGTIPFEELYNSDARINDPHQDLVSFPADDISIQYFTKHHRTSYAAKPVTEYEEQLEPYVKVCFEFFSADWTLLKFKTYGYTKHHFETSVYDLELPLYDGDDIRKFLRDRPKRIPASPMLSRGQGATLRKRGASLAIAPKDVIEPILTPDDPHFNYMKPYTKRTDIRNKKIRSKDRLEIFQYYDPNYDWQPGTEVALCNRIRKTLRPDTKHEVKFKPFYFSVEPIGLVFQLGELEPFFCTLALYQIDQQSKEVKKISETFSYQKNSHQLIDRLPGSIPWILPDSPLETKKGLFSVSRRTAHVYLVLEVFKVLQGDPEISIDPYARIATVSRQKEQGKVKGRIEHEVEEYCKRLGKYYQHFCWSALQVFDAKGNLLLPDTTRFEVLYARNARDTVPSLVQMLAAGEQKKLGKDLHGICSIHVHKVQEEDIAIATLIDPSLQVVQPESVTTDAPSAVLKEIYEFPQHLSFIPNFFYVNNMYIYPLCANLSNKNGRNIVIRMEVKDDDFDVNSPGLKCICNPFSVTELTDHIYTAVHYHNKTPHFNDEFKIILPPRLSDKHHLLFTLYHVVVAKKKKVEEVEVVVGYAVVPLFRNGRIVVHNNGDSHGVNLYTKLESEYMIRILAEPAVMIISLPFLYLLYFKTNNFVHDCENVYFICIRKKYKIQS